MDWAFLGYNVPNVSEIQVLYQVLRWLRWATPWRFSFVKLVYFMLHLNGRLKELELFIQIIWKTWKWEKYDWSSNPCSLRFTFDFHFYDVSFNLENNMSTKKWFVFAWNIKNYAWAAESSIALVKPEYFKLKYQFERRRVGKYFFILQKMKNFSIFPTRFPLSLSNIKLKERRKLLFLLPLISWRIF